MTSNVCVTECVMFVCAAMRAMLLRRHVQQATPVRCSDHPPDDRCDMCHACITGHLASFIAPLNSSSIFWILDV